MADVSTKALLRAAKLSASVAGRHIGHGFGNVLVTQGDEGVVISASDYDRTIQAVVPCIGVLHGSVAVRASTFLAVCSALPGDSVDLRHAEGMLHIGSSFCLRGVPTDSMPDMSIDAEWTPCQASDLLDVLSIAVRLSRDETKPGVTCVWMNGERAAAFYDGGKGLLTVGTNLKGAIPHHAVAPASALLTADECDVCMTERNFAVRCDGVSFQARLPEGAAAPERWEQFMEYDGKWLSLDSNALRDALRGCITVSADRVDHACTFTPSIDGMFVETGGDLGAYSRQLSGTGALGKGARLSPGRMLDFITPNIEVDIASNEHQVHIRHGSRHHVLMGMFG